MTWTHSTDLRDARKRAGLTQFEAAELVGVRERTWGAWERGTSDPSIENLRAVVERLKIPPQVVGYESPRGWDLVPDDWIRSEFRTMQEKLDTIIKRQGRTA